MFASDGLTLPGVIVFGVAAALLVYLVIRFLTRSERSRWYRIERMPWRLRRCKVFLNEQEIHTEGPLPMHGKSDQVLEQPNGKLIVIDTKTRARPEVFIHDIIQLSVYRYILTHGYGRKVSPHGYVRVVQTSPGRAPTVTYLKVRLLGDLALTHLWNEYTAIRNGEFQAPCRCGGKYH